MKKKEIIMIAVILSIAFFVYLFTLWNQNANGNRYVVVYVDGTEYGRYSLDIEQEVKIISEGDGYNNLVISDHMADVISASCPDELCVHQASVDKNGESIICLPNKVVVEIVSDEDSEYDMVAE